METPEFLRRRIDELERKFIDIANTCMQDVPIQNPKLWVQAVGFESAVQADGRVESLLGVLITPWFMNLLRLPLQPHLASPGTLSSGRTATHDIGGHRFDFIFTPDEDIGAYESCSLFSPMFEFANQEMAIATALEVLKLLRAPVAPEPAHTPGRRAFLFGRDRAERPRD